MALPGRIWYWGGMTLLLAGFAVHLYGMALRIIAAGRPPVSNIYESMIFVAAAILLFALIFELVYRSRIFALTAAGLGVVALVLSETLPVSSEIAPLVPVLRSTTWLTFHVLTILMGYSAAFGRRPGVRRARLLCGGPRHRPLAVRLDKFHYRVVQVAVLFLGSGIILGAGCGRTNRGDATGARIRRKRGRSSRCSPTSSSSMGAWPGWLKRFGTNVASVIGLNMVIMTYYGVNYFLVGLHSYAPAAPHSTCPVGLLVRGGGSGVRDAGVLRRGSERRRRRRARAHRWARWRRRRRAAPTVLPNGALASAPFVVSPPCIHADPTPCVGGTRRNAPWPCGSATPAKPCGSSRERGVLAPIRWGARRMLSFARPAESDSDEGATAPSSGIFAPRLLAGDQGTRGSPPLLVAPKRPFARMMPPRDFPLNSLCSVNLLSRHALDQAEGAVRARARNADVIKR
jgi:ABC-type transport system involved in cytochrome c biogenesis permease subunit